MTPEQQNRIKGLFFGQAVGDALGVGTEFMSAQQIAKYYPNGCLNYSDFIQDEFRSKFEHGAWSDDTDQFLCICEAIIKNGSPTTIGFAKELMTWLKNGPADIGRTVYNVITLPNFAQEPHKAAKLVWDASGKKSAANGAIMRTSILGAFKFWDIEEVIRNTEAIAKVTHYDPRSVGSSVVLCYLIAQLINGLTVDAAVLKEIAGLYHPEIATYIDLALENNISVLKLDDGRSMGYTLKTLGAALWTYFSGLSFREGVLAVVHAGGDADTNACVAGSLLGVKYGFDAIPNNWVQELHQYEFMLQKFEDFMAVNVQ